MRPTLALLQALNTHCVPCTLRLTVNAGSRMAAGIKCKAARWTTEPGRVFVNRSARAAWSRMSWQANLKSGFEANGAKNFQFPVDRLSSPMTGSFRSKRCSTTCEPRKPAAPVTSQGEEFMSVLKTYKSRASVYGQSNVARAGETTEATLRANQELNERS